MGQSGRDYIPNSIMELRRIRWKEGLDRIFSAVAPRFAKAQRWATRRPGCPAERNST